MTETHLLPANATPLEKALSLAMDGLSRLALSADAVRAFKRDAGNPLLPWLIWEYGLEELMPYLPDPRRAIAEGILWQRLRGTSAALTTALSWIGKFFSFHPISESSTVHSNYHGDTNPEGASANTR